MPSHAYGYIIFRVISVSSGLLNSRIDYRLPNPLLTIMRLEPFKKSGIEFERKHAQETKARL